MFVIEDNIHGEQWGDYNSFDEALNEIKRRSTIPWDEEPNCPPCTSWKTCERNYLIIEYDNNSEVVNQTKVLKISSKEIKWLV